MTLDVDEYPDLAAEYKVSRHTLSIDRTLPLLIEQVSALPTVVAFKNGKVANKFGESRHDHTTIGTKAHARQLVSGRRVRSRSSWHYCNGSSRHVQICASVINMEFVVLQTLSCSTPFRDLPLVPFPRPPLPPPFYPLRRRTAWP